VLGLLFVKYVSDAFDIRRQELVAQFKDLENEYYLNPDDYETDEEYQSEIEAELGELIYLIATIPFVHASLQAKDILGHVYECFLGQFALAEGKKGGQFYTPTSIVTLIVEMLQPYQGRVYDPAMGSGGFFVQGERFIKEHGGKLGNVSIYGQEYNHTTWPPTAPWRCSSPTVL
jgi:type I restriction-modification system DNA methylase subunit